MLRLLASLVLAVMPFAAAAQQPWEGLWLRAEVPCNDATAQELGVRISRSEVEGAPYFCRILDIQGRGTPSWTLQMRCTEGGPSENLTHLLSLTKAGTLIRRDRRTGAQEEMARCTAISPATQAAIRDRRRFQACEGSGCRLTAMEWNNLDEPNAWAVGRPGAEDAEQTCHVERGLKPGSDASKACLKEQLARPPVKITANCIEATTSLGGRRYRLTDAAREGALPNAELAGYWDTTPPFSVPDRATLRIMATHMRVLCPTTSLEWSMRPAD